MTDNYIQLKKKNNLVFKIKDENGKLTGEELIFDVNDIELPLKYQELIEQDKKNKQWLRNQSLIINKRQDVKGKKLLSKNEEDMIQALNEFYKKETEVYNMFLGENGVQKLLNGEKMGWDSLSYVDDIINNEIRPLFEKNVKGLQEMIKEKYSVSNESDVLK